MTPAATQIDPLGIEDRDPLGVESAGEDPLGIEAAPKIDWSKIKGEGVFQPSGLSSGAGSLVHPGDNPDSAFLQEVANDPKDFLKSLPEAAISLAGAPGKVAYAGAADVISKAAGQPEYGGNIEAMKHAEELPAERFIGEAAKTNPKLATTAYVAEALPELASMMVANPPGAAGRLVALGFSADMIHKAKPLFEEYADEYYKAEGERDPGKLALLRAGILQTFTFAPLAGKHGLAGERTAPGMSKEAATANAEAVKATLPRFRAADDPLMLETQAAKFPAREPAPGDQLMQELQRAQATKAAEAKPLAGFGELIGSKLDDLEARLKAVEQPADGGRTSDVPPPLEVRTPDGAIDPVQTALAQMRAAGVLTPEAEPATSKAGAAAETGTGQKERTGSDAGEATTLAPQQMPAERETSPKAAPTPLKRRLSPITDANGLLFDIVANHGKIPIYLPDNFTAANWQRLSAKYKAGGFAAMTPKERDYYLRLKEKLPQDFEDNYGPDGGSYARHAYYAAKRAGVDVELFAPTKDGRNLRFSQLMDFVRNTQGEDFTPGDLWHTIERIANEHGNRRVTEKQAEQFAAKVLAGERPKAQGATFDVKSRTLDETGTPILRVKDGPKFGDQEVAGNETLHVDKGSFEAGPEHAEAPAPAKPPVPSNAEVGGETRGTPLELREEPPLFGQPETVEGQRTRLALENQRRAEAAAREEMERRANAPLVGKTGDIGQKDLFGGGDLFSETPKALLDRKSELDAIAQDLYGKTYDELPEGQRGAVEVTLEAEDIQGRQQLDRAPGRQPGDQGKPAGPKQLTADDFAAPAGQLQPAAAPAAKAAPEKELSPVEYRLQTLRADAELLQANVGKWHPDTPTGRNLRERLAYVRGQITMLQGIAESSPDVKAEWLRKFVEGEKPDVTTRILTALDSLKINTDGQLHAFGLVPEAWNTLIDLVKLGVRGGKQLREAIGWAVQQFKRRNPEAKFDEKAVEDYLITADEAEPLRADFAAAADEGAKERKRDQNRAEFQDEFGDLPGTPAGKPQPKLAPPKAPARPAEVKFNPNRPQRPFPEVQTDLATAEQTARAAVKREPNAKQADYQQAKALAAARYRELRDELLSHPDYVAEQLLRNHDALTEAAALLEPHGIKLRFNTFPDPYAVEAALGPKQAARVRELLQAVEQSQQELQQMNSKQVARVHQAMQADGRLPKAQTLDANAGRSIAQITDWLQENHVDSPRQTWRERLDLAGRVADRWRGLKDAASIAWAKTVATTKAAAETYKHPPKDTDFRRVVKSWIFADQRTGLESHKFVQALTREVRSPLRRQAMSVWLDARGDLGLLRAQAASVPERFQKVWQTAMKLTPAERDLALKIKADFETKLEDGINVGLLERGREHYGVPQRWKIRPEGEPNADPIRREKKGSPGNPYAKLDPRDPFFSFERQVPTYFDGIMAKGVPESLDITHLVESYHQAFHKSLSSRGAIGALQSALMPDGLPAVKVSGSASAAPGAEGKRAFFVDSKTRGKSDVTADGRPYRALNHFALRDWKIAFKTGDGAPIIVKGDMLIHPDAFEFLKNELGTSRLREGKTGAVMRPLLKTSGYLKASKLAASFFHLATIGEHMMSHLANPFLNGFKLDLRQPEQALLVRNGLELGMSSPRMMYEEGLMSGHGGLFGQVPYLGELSTKMTDWMFRDYIPAIMMKVGLKGLEANRRRYSKELTDDQIAELTAQQMNAAGGLLNYRLRGAEGNFWGQLGNDKTLMDIQRLFLLAPQFLEARARVVGQALKPYGAEQRKMLIVQAAALYVGCRVLNQLLDDDPHWHDNPFGVVFRGRSYSIRTIVGDFWHALTDPKSFVAGRLSPFSRIGIETLTQRDMRTGARKEPVLQTEWMPGRVAQNLVVDMARWLAPITVEGMLPGAAGREQSPVAMALSSVGVGSRKFTATMQVNDWASDFNRASDDPQARRFQLQKDGGAYAESRYRKLDTLLDAGETARALAEYEALLKEGIARQTIAQRYNDVTRPFTGRGDRERAFKTALDERKRGIYQKAIEERKARREAFRTMRRKLLVPETEPDET